MTAFVHPEALCETRRVGEGTRIWAFAHVLSGAVVGRDCNICDGVFIENDVVIGDRVTVKCGVQLWDGVSLADDVFVGPNATFSNDPFPRSRRPPAQFARTVVQKGASIGANATILPGLTIGAGAMVGAGSVVTRSVPRHAIVVGNPARIVGYVETEEATSVAPAPGWIETPEVAGVQLIQLPRIADMRGELAVTEFQSLPFQPRRSFVVFSVPSAEVRGEHAHRRCHQLLIAVHGSLRVVVDDGRQRREFLMDRPNLALHVGPMVWATQYQYSRDAVLQVLASEAYDATDYIRDYDEFLAELSVQKNPASDTMPNSSGAG